MSKRAKFLITIYDSRFTIPTPLPFKPASLTLALIVSTSNEPTPLIEQPASTPINFGQSAAGQTTTVATVDPNNPPWGIIAGILTWVGSVLLLFIIGLLIVLPY